MPACWIIPARAGFTFGRAAAGRSLTDHPRSRGVYVFVVCLTAWLCGSSPLARGLQSFCPRSPVPKYGSSPLARGLHHGQERGDDLLRIIPARAGFTSHASLVIALMPDHPRSRGVYRLVNACPHPASGSSPLARGLRWPHEAPSAGPRIIPARAGFTRPRAEPRRGTPDHPRSRGVYTAMHLEADLSIGSSPLARGLRRVYL